MATRRFTRRAFGRGLAAGTGIIILIRRGRAAEFALRQYHNQPVESPLHKRLLEMWAAVSKETDGHVLVQVTPENNHMKDGDPDPLEMLRRGELEFYTQAGNGLAGLVPAANVQATPFAFRTEAQVYRAIDGDIGTYLREELKAKGVFLLPYGCFDNGFHQITTASRPIRTAGDLEGLKMRVPGSPVYLEFFKTLGAVTTTMNINRLHDALKSGLVEAQEDPLDVAELFRLYEVQKFMSITNHSWSGYNQLANLKMWQALPADVRGAIERNTRKYTRLQRGDNAALNGKLRRELEKQGMIFNDADTASMRAPLAAFYARWKNSIGSRATSLLEAHTGKLG